MIGDDAGGVSGGQRAKVRCLMGVKIAGPRESRIDEPIVAQPWGTAEFRQKDLVNRE